MSIRVFVTGGTFDKEYNELAGTLFFKTTHVPEMLALGRCKVDVDVQTLMMIDSLDMTDADRALILEHCRRAREERVLVGVASTDDGDSALERRQRALDAQRVGWPSERAEGGGIRGVEGEQRDA